MRSAVVRVGRQLSWLVVTVSILASAQQIPQGISETGMAKIAEIMAEKARRTPTENKLDSNLLYGMRAMAARRAGLAQTEAPYVASFIDGNVASDGTVEVTIRAAVSDDLLSALTAAGAQDVASFPQFDTITARLPIVELMVIAVRADVRFIGPTEKPVTNRYVPTPEEIKARLARYPHLGQKAGSVNSEGVVAHKANVAFNTGINGTGVFICAMSNGIDSLSARQASGDLPPVVYVLSGQAGVGDEGTAMLEIIHDMAPGATLGYATAGNPTAAQMANNIDSLRLNGCNVIVDDATVPDEGAFQDGIIAQAVSRFTAAGGLYFSSSANSGNLTHLNSGTWEGDFVDSGISFVPDGPASRIHAYGAFISNALQNSQASRISLKWSDPLGAATNDYDLFLLDSGGSTILQASSNPQAVTLQPYESFTCTPASCPPGAQVVIVKYSGVQRALRLDTHRGKLGYATSGSTFGHNAAATAISVAAVDVATAGGGAFVGGAANPVENFSSDGPRRMFYNPNGTAITPGNVLFGTGGGTTLQKVDIAAANRVSTSTPGYSPFPGTSAAAPHAAAIAALAWSAKPTATAAAVKAALFASALDIEAAGVDRDSGVGIVMADASVRAMLNPISITKSFNPPRIAPGGTSTLTIALTNSNAVALQNVAFTDSYPPQIVNTISPNVTGTGSGCAGTLNGAASGGSVSMTAGIVPAGGTCTITVQVTASTVGAFADNSGTVTTPIALNTPGASATLTVVAISVAPTTLPGGTFNTAYSQNISASGGVSPYGFTVTAGSVPNGLSLAAGGTLSGTPTAAGNFNFTATATDSTAIALGGPFTASRNYSVTIASANQSISFGTPANRALYSGSFPVSATATSGLVVAFSSQTPSICTVAGNTVSLVSVGTCTVRASQLGDGNWNAAANVDQSFSVTAPPITLSPASVPAGTVGVAYVTQNLAASGGVGPYGFAVNVGALPGGLTLSATGVLSGTPTTAGNFNFTVAGTDSSGALAGGPFTGSQGYAVAVAKGNQVIAFAPLNGKVFGAAPFTVSATAAPGLTVAFASLTPAVCTVNITLVTLAGFGQCTIRASQAGDANYNPAANVDRSFPVADPTITVSPVSLPDSALTLAYSQNISATGGIAPRSFTVSVGTLPGGLNLATGGALTGAANATGSFSFTVTATDSTPVIDGGPLTGSRAYTVNISNYLSSVAATSNFNPSAFGQTVTFTAAVSGAGPTPTGTVTFYDGAAVMCSGVTVAVGQAICTYDALSTGSRSITATYSGDGNYGGSTSANYSQSVIAANSRVLTVTKGGTGNGTVTSSPAGINCGADCTEPYASTTAVTLTAAPALGSTFIGWLGDCKSIGPCALSVSAATSALATFAPDGALASLDIDGNSNYNALTDGLLALRYMFGLTGAPLTVNALGDLPVRFTPDDVAQYMANIRPMLDIDRNGQVDPLTDGVLVMRYLFGLRGDALVADALGQGATRTPAEIEAHLQSLTP